MLTPEQQTHLKDRLGAEKRKLGIEIEALDQAINEKADCSIADQADAAALNERRHRAASLRAHHEQTLQEIDAALRRIETGRYGVSEESGEPIAFERLDVVPWARTE